MDFREAWRRIGALEDATFVTDRGRKFSYRFKKTFVVVEPGGLSIPRTNFEKVHRRAADGSAISVQGESYVQAVYADPRFVRQGE